MKIMNLFVVSVLIVVSQSAIANVTSNTTVEFNTPEKFTDFKTRTNLNAKDRDRLMRQLQKLISKSAAKVLPEGTDLKIMVNNVDMAGNFIYSGDPIDVRGQFINPSNDSVRVINESDTVGFEFYYKLVGSDGNVLSQGDVNLATRNPKAIARYSKKYKHSYFTYIMPLFDEWLGHLSME